MNTHIDFRPDDTERLQNVGELREVIRQHGPRPVIVCGDFNDTPGSRVHRTMKEVMEDTWELVGLGEGPTFSADKPAKRIDYLWIGKDKSLVLLKAWVPQSDASDHLPVVGEFRLR
jgi:endonuclease/exonuclease/phosphatase (EEP) superfamily protein YafD